jgi:AraC-like DNA-binding protein
MTPVHYDATTPLIPASHQAAVLVEHLRSLDLDPAPLLNGLGLTPDAMDGPRSRLSPLQMAALLRGAAQALGDPELSFQLGRQLLPGHYGAASHALLTAGTLRRALQVLVRHATRLSPLLVPHLVMEERHAVLHWTDGSGSAGLRTFLVELQMSGVVATCQWLAGQRLPWTFLFNRGEPARRDAHEAFLGTALRFACHLDAMMIDAEWLDRPWANPRALCAPALAEALDREAQVQEPRRHLLALVYERLHDQVRQPLALEALAAGFGLSPATFKRRLAACGTHFQAELDQVRLHTALRLMHGRGLDNEAVARHLGYDDAANFRRSMKRWAGLTPSQLRLGLAA